MFLIICVTRESHHRDMTTTDNMLCLQVHGGNGTLHASGVGRLIRRGLRLRRLRWREQALRLQLRAGRERDRDGHVRRRGTLYRVSVHLFRWGAV